MGVMIKFLAIVKKLRKENKRLEKEAESLKSDLFFAEHSKEAVRIDRENTIVELQEDVDRLIQLNADLAVKLSEYAKLIVEEVGKRKKEELWPWDRENMRPVKIDKEDSDE